MTPLNDLRSEIKDIAKIEQSQEEIVWSSWPSLARKVVEYRETLSVIWLCSDRKIIEWIESISIEKRDKWFRSLISNRPTYSPGDPILDINIAGILQAPHSVLRKLESNLFAGKAENEHIRAWQRTMGAWYETEDENTDDLDGSPFAPEFPATADWDEIEKMNRIAKNN